MRLTMKLTLRAAGPWHAQHGESWILTFSSTLILCMCVQQQRPRCWVHFLENRVVVITESPAIDDGVPQTLH